MRPCHQPLQRGRLHFDASGIPASERYGDVYHARAGALEQARHVFINGNDLPRRWAGRDAFTVCETGFGLGNNFLTLWQTWRAAPDRPRRLHVVSFEAHPFSRVDLAAGLAGHHGEIGELAQALIDAWPPLTPGLHRLEFEDGSVTLTLAFGRAEHLSRQVDASVDAFFLDGFSPARNPAMWSRELFGQLVRIANVGATAATWCSAGQVRRDLAAAGFLVERAPGFGGKRQMSRAVLRPGLGRPLRSAEQRDVLVVGGGLAGAGIAHSLALRGHSVTVLDPTFSQGRAGGHEGHRCAAMTPALSRDDNVMSRLSRAGVLLAGMRWKGMAGVSRVCGSLVRVDAAESPLWQQALAHWQFPAEWMTWSAAEESERRCGLPLKQDSIWLGYGTLVRPAQLVPALLAHARIRVLSHHVARLCESSVGWQARSAQGECLAEATYAVIATASQSSTLLAQAMPGVCSPKLATMQRMGGQVSHFRAGALPSSTAIIAGAGYWLPAEDGMHIGGSTYEYETEEVAPTEEGTRTVAFKIARLLDLDPERLLAARVQGAGWAGWRAALSDHLPVIGPANKQETLWVSCAFGSRGLSWMTLAGEILAARLNNEPQVVERELIRALRLR